MKERAGEKKKGEEEGKKRVMTPWLSKLKKGSATTARPGDFYFYSTDHVSYLATTCSCLN